MDETFNINAIVINRKDFREHDARLQVFSFEDGKMDLVARGAKKINSKIMPFVEPITNSKIMVVRGKKYDYVGGADIVKSYIMIKSDLERSLIAGRILQLYNKFTRDKSKDEALYKLLKNALDIIDESKIDLDFFADVFTIKFFYESGYGFELYNCVACGKKITKTDNVLNFEKGGIVCQTCLKKSMPDNAVLTISPESIIVLRLIDVNSINKLINIKTKTANKNEIKNISGNLIKFYSS